MRSFKNIDIPIILNTSSNDLVEDFFKPVLSNSIKYDRGVGYFSSGWLQINSIGMAKFAENNGHARWITSPILDEEDWKALLAGEQAKEDIILRSILQSCIPNIREGLETQTLSALSWLIADDVIEFKIAIPRNILERGEFHDKFGIFFDSDGEKISFSGSYNDSIRGTRNYESIKVFKSWIQEYSDLVLSEQDRFDSLWINQDPNLQVYDLPSAAKEEIIKFRSKKRPYKKNEDKKVNILDLHVSDPNIPRHITLRDYQNEAINRWENNGFHGIFEMATGTGKTITALSATVRVLSSLPKLAIIIACPLQHLVVQWQEEAEKFGFFPLLAFDSKSTWFDNVNERILEFNHNDITNICIITTYDTFISDHFQKALSRIIGPSLFIGDEVHHLGSEKRQNKLPSHIDYRLGLSATPTRWYDEKGTKGIINYFGEIIYKFSLAKAIEEGFLTQYYYYPIIIELTEEEIIEYELLSKKIGVLFNMGEDPNENEGLLKLLIKRSEILQIAENKIPKVVEVIDQLENISHTLFYCAPKQIGELTRILGRSKHLRVHQFTYHEDHLLREKLIHEFDKGILQALLAIKCLDEGVDIPSTRTAFFLSSSSNPREFIQRRGRILRNFPGKDFAEIYDLVVTPPLLMLKSDIERKIFKRELQRFKEFAENSKNFNSAYEIIWDLAKSYEIFDL